MCACAIEQYVVSAITEVIRPTPGTWRARSLADTALGGVWHDVFELMPKGDVKRVKAEMAKGYTLGQSCERCGIPGNWQV